MDAECGEEGGVEIFPHGRFATASFAQTILWGGPQTARLWSSTPSPVHHQPPNLECFLPEQRSSRDPTDP